MKKIEDERIKFYLEHRDLIDEWSKISEEIPRVCGEFMWALSEGVAALAERLGPDVNVYEGKSEKSDNPKIFLYRESWYSGGDHRYENRVDVGIGVEWHKKHVDFGLPRKRPYVGIWTNDRNTRGESAHKVLSDKIDGKNSFSYWVTRTYIAPEQDDFWNDLQSYATLLLKNIEEAWNRYAEGVDEALSEVDETTAPVG